MSPRFAALSGQERLLRRGLDRLLVFAEANPEIPPMRVVAVPREEWFVNACAYWRGGVCNICLPECARPCGEAMSRAWSWPGSNSDRTPYGVVAHEYGHHVDVYESTRTGGRVGSYFGSHAAVIRERSGEAPISGYHPNEAEWFAEMFRLFVTNHALLMLTRPRTWGLLAERWRPVGSDDWRENLAPGTPARVIAALTKKIAEAARRVKDNKGSQPGLF
jgi:hypothetical protein